MYYMHSVICILLMFVPGYLPPFGEMTTLGMVVLGIFVGMLYGWFAIGFVWPSLLGLIALGLTEYGTMQAVFTEAFGDKIVLILLFMFIFAGILERCGLINYIANWMISRRICEGKPWVLTTLLFLAAIITCAFINMFAGIFIVWSVFYKICDMTGYKKGDNYVCYVLFGTIILGALAQLMLPFLPMSLVLRALLKFDLTEPTMALTTYSLGLMMVYFFSIMVLGKWILKLDVSALQNLPQRFYDEARAQKMNQEQRMGMLLLIAFVVLLMMPSLLPKTIIPTFLTKLDVIGTIVLLICYVVFKGKESKDTEGPYNFSAVVRSGVNWEIIILMAATMPIAAAIESDSTGIMKTILAGLMPIFQQISPTIFLILTIIIFMLATQITHNMVLKIAFMPILASIGYKMGINPYMFYVLFCFSVQFAFLTPGASAQAALIFGNTHWIERRQAYKFSALFVIVGMVFTLIVGIPIGYLIF